MRKDEEDPKITEEDSITRRTVSRREFLKYAGVAGAIVGAGGGLGGLLAACGEDETTTTTAGEATTTTAGEATTTTAGEATTTTMAGPEPPAQDVIVFGGARPISGGLSSFEEQAFGPSYKMWVKQVNEAGGINVAGKMLPIELKIYDDTSDLDTSMRLLTKLMEEDKVDFVFPPTSTAFVFAAAGVTSAHGYILMSSENGATTLEPKIFAGELPFFFQCLTYANHYQMPAFATVCKDLGVQTVATLYIDDLHGIEYSAQAKTFFADAGIKTVLEEAMPYEPQDESTVLRQIEELNPDVICSFQYPPGQIVMMQQLIQFGINPKGLLLGPGGSFAWFYDIFGEAVMDGVMFEGAWSPNTSPECKTFYDAYTKEWGFAPDAWGALIYNSELEFLQAAIEKAATLDQEVVAEVMKTEHLPTTMNPDTFFTNQIFDGSCYAGQIGQYQSGVAEVIDTYNKQTAAPVYPKPPWPAA